MISPLFPTLNADGKVKSLLGGDKIRVYPFGQQSSPIQYPYIVWQVISGSPENFLGTRPDIDSYSIQVDIYSLSLANCIDCATAVRDAIEGNAYITRWGTQEIETETKAYRLSFDVDWYEKR